MFSRRRRSRPPRAVSPWPFVGMGLMAASFFLYAVSGLVAPAWGVVVLLLVWLAMLLLCFAWWTPHPQRLPWVGVLSVVVWFAALTAGGAFLGWTA